MPGLSIILDVTTTPIRELVELGIENAAEDPRVLHPDPNAEGLTVGGIPNGMSSGKASVCFIVPLEGGDRLVIAETSLALLASATRALCARYGMEDLLR
jgi:hypothetical protein